MPFDDKALDRAQYERGSLAGYGPDLSVAREMGPVRGTLFAVASLLLWVVLLPVRLLAALVRGLLGLDVGGRASGTADWFNRQWTGTVRRTKAMYDWFAFDAVIPPAIADQIQNLWTWTWQATGIRGNSRTSQFRAAVILALLAVLSSIISFGLTLGFVALFGAFAMLALARNVPAIGSAWTSLTNRLGLKQDYDIPRWRRD